MAEPRHLTPEDDSGGRSRLLGLARLAAVYFLVGAMLSVARPAAAGLAAGAVLLVAGEALRLWAAGHLIKTDKLITSGPYRYTRNPLYLGRLLIFSGLCVMAKMPHGTNWLVLTLGYIVFFGYYLPRKERVEPARLRAIHGESYERYRRAVPSLLPSLRPFDAASTDRWCPGRMLRNREHWMVFALLAATAFLLWRA